MNGIHYQVVARFLYRNLLERPDGIFGFVVNLEWARQHYFPDMLAEVSRIPGAEPPLALSIFDSAAHLVSGETQIISDTYAHSARRFQLMFFDPLLVAVDQPATLKPEVWIVRATGSGDPKLAAAVRGADWTIAIAAIAAGSLAVGFTLTLRAVRSETQLSLARSEFAATVTHELKTPVATIRFAGETLLSGSISTPSDQQTYAQVVVQQSKRLSLLIDNLIALSKITEPADVYVVEPVALEVIIEDTLHTFSTQLQEAGFHVEVTITPETCHVAADPRALSLAFDNLVDNAIRYSPDVRHLEIQAKQVGAKVSIEIRDHGQGIPPDEVAHVTRKFYRGRDSHQRGSGLGLAIVKRIVEAHGGVLSIESIVGKGTAVNILLPGAVES
jgi:signal transduction histidine kinase